MQPSLFTPAAPKRNPAPPTTPQIQPPQPLAISQVGRFQRNASAQVSTDEIWCLFQTGRVYSTVKTTEWYLNQTEYWFWDRTMECGKSYLVGDMPMGKYLKSHSSPLNDWQKLAYQWAIENPDQILHVVNKTHEWRVYLRGEFVEFELPYQTRGGEKNYVSRTGKTKVLVNVD